jgi:hypothetical protein
VILIVVGFRAKESRHPYQYVNGALTISCECIKHNASNVTAIKKIKGGRFSRLTMYFQE